MSDTTDTEATVPTTSSDVSEESKEYPAKIKWYNPRKNYGFATILETDQDIFIHKNSIVGNSIDEERFWNKCVFEGEFVTMTLRDDNGRITGENIKCSHTERDGSRKPLLFANPNMKTYINKFKERWENAATNNSEWKTVQNNKPSY
jgi:hypothetical protein